MLPFMRWMLLLRLFLLRVRHGETRISINLSTAIKRNGEKSSFWKFGSPGGGSRDPERFKGGGSGAEIAEIPGGECEQIGETKKSGRGREGEKKKETVEENEGMSCVWLRY